MSHCSSVLPLPESLSGLASPVVPQFRCLTSPLASGSVPCQAADSPRAEPSPRGTHPGHLPVGLPSLSVCLHIIDLRTEVFSVLTPPTHTPAHHPTPIRCQKCSGVSKRAIGCPCVLPALGRWMCGDLADWGASVPRVLRCSHCGVLGWPGFPACLSLPSQVPAGCHMQPEAPGYSLPPPALTCTLGVREPVQPRQEWVRASRVWHPLQPCLGRVRGWNRVGHSGCADTMFLQPAACWDRGEPQLSPEALWACPEQKVPRKSAWGPAPARGAGEQFGSHGPGGVGSASSLPPYARHAGRQVVLAVSPTTSLTTEMAVLPRSLKKGIFHLLVHGCKIPHCHEVGFLVSTPSTDAADFAGRRAQGSPEPLQVLSVRTGPPLSPLQPLLEHGPGCRRPPVDTDEWK